MYIRTFLLSILLSGMVVFFPLQSYADSYSQGVQAYKNRNYNAAIQYFQEAVRRNPKDANGVFYLGMAYTHAGKYDEARQAFEAVIQMVPSSHELAQKSRNNITVITRDQIKTASNSGKATRIMQASLSRNAKDNYLTHVIPGGKVVHFAPEKMPLRVYIANGSGVPNWNNGLKQVVIDAMSTWSRATNGRVRFVQTYNESDADIVVRWQRNFSDNILGVSPWQSAGDTLIRSDIQLATFYPDSGQPIPYNELQAIAIHEMGHAIGIKGHSPYPEDIMYYSKSSRNSRISQRDVNTINLLYKIDADIKNNTSMSTASTKRYYELFDLGYKAQTGGQAAQAMQYYRQAMQLNRNLPEAKFNLGSLLINEGNRLARANNLKAAKSSFQEAVQLFSELSQSGSAPDSTKENLNIARQNLALVSQYVK